MAKNTIIEVWCFGKEIGRVGFDENARKSYFQYNPTLLEKKEYPKLFPPTGIIRRMPQTQIYSKFNNDTFRNLPPQIADSLPDMFGNIVFKAWLEASQKGFEQISVIEQLAYVGNRGMGALEYRPSKEIPKETTIDVEEIVGVVKDVLNQKKSVKGRKLNQEALLNVFKLGTSAGGARPKILISEHLKTGAIIPGDLEYSAAYNHYLVKLDVEDDVGYSREKVEFCYYQTATQLGIRMMPCKLIDDKHFATLRFDRQAGQKKHVLTATGMTGWDFKDPTVSSYENIFELALFLKLPHSEIEELFKRLVFNIVFCNTDDHLKNHAFIYNEQKDQWNLSPAYDLTFSLNPLLNYRRISRALSVNNKRIDVDQNDLLVIAETYTIKHPEGIFEEISAAIEAWKNNAQNLGLSNVLIANISKRFKPLV